ncbi:MAG: type II secretion system protein, partial [Verrucomicrobiota bacterium]
MPMGFGNSPTPMRFRTRKVSIVLFTSPERSKLMSFARLVKMKTASRRRNAFTLIELLVVIAI